MYSFLLQRQTILMETAERVMAEGNSDFRREIGTNKQCIFFHPPTDVKGSEPLPHWKGESEAHRHVCFILWTVPHWFWVWKQQSSLQSALPFPPPRMFCIWRMFRRTYLHTLMSKPVALCLQQPNQLPVLHLYSWAGIWKGVQSRSAGWQGNAQGQTSNKIHNGRAYRNHSFHSFWLSNPSSGVRNQKIWIKRLSLMQMDCNSF